MKDFLYIAATFLTAFTISYLTIPSIIYISKRKRLFDVPNGRSSHKSPTPRTGGVAIFLGFVISFLMWDTYVDFLQIKYILISLVLLFSAGLKDDLIGLSVDKKFFIQLGIGFLIAFGGIRLTGFHGVFGIEEIPIVFQYLFTIVVVVGITNAYNLIDGIDGLAGGIGLIAALTLGSFLYLMGDVLFALMSFTLAGSLIAFLCFNFQPAKIFMGDTGSLILGFLLSVLAIRFIEFNYSPANSFVVMESAPAFAMSILFIPIFDTLRVFTVRILKGQSPFRPDQRHIHHILLSIGMTHAKAAITLYCANIGMIILASACSQLGTLSCILALFFVGILFVECLMVVQYLQKRKATSPVGVINKKS